LFVGHRDLDRIIRMATLDTQRPNYDVSRQAATIARMIDRLGPGMYTIHLSLPGNSSERWTIEIVQPVTVLQKREVTVGKAQEEGKV